MNYQMLNVALLVFTVAMSFVAIEYLAKLIERLAKGRALAVAKRVHTWQDELEKIYDEYDEVFESWWVGDGLDVAKVWAKKQVSIIIDEELSGLPLPEPVREMLEKRLGEQAMDDFIDKAHSNARHYIIDRLTRSRRKDYERRAIKLAGDRQRAVATFEEYDQHMADHVENLIDIGYDVEKLNSIFPIQ